MAMSSWTREENDQFKDAVQLFSAFLPNRYECIAQYLRKSVVDVREHYQEMVDDLLEIRSSQIDLSNGMNAGKPSWYQNEIPIWDKEEHEWFLIGLRRFGRDCDKIAVLLVTKTSLQVAMYASNFFNWHNSKNHGIKHVPSQPQPQQGPVALETGQGANIYDSELNNLP